ncbi:MAG: hypothetical protein ACREEM_18450 [Blastocatellia bacterium]
MLTTTKTGKTGAKAKKTAAKAKPADAITDFQLIYRRLREIFSQFTPPLTVTADVQGRYETVSKKDLVVSGRKLTEMCFGGVVIWKNFVGLYFFPIYTHPQSFTGLPDEVKKCLKGKSCFNVKKADDKLFRQIEKMAKQGFKLYKQEKWI